MSEWNDNPYQEQPKKEQRPASGPWDVVLTVFTLLATGTAAFLIAFLTRNNESRPFWLLGLCFALPVAALMGSVLLKEKIMPRMTPSTSRGAQALLALGSILAAAVVGCFCRVSNTGAGVVTEEIRTTGTSNVLIILDKSGSMSENSRDRYATQAVTELIRGMEPDTEVGMLIDVGWKENNSGSNVVPLEERMLPIAALTDSHRAELLKMAEFDLKINENFPRAFETALQMIRDYPGDTEKLTILVISDGEDCTYRFRAADYQDELIAAGVRVHYLYVCEPYSTEMAALSEATGGESIFVKDNAKLTEEMKSVTITQKTEVVSYSKDALRDIEESPTSKAVTGVLLLLEGLLIGFSLMIMLSVHKQKRFQVILSPLCAVAAFLLLAFGRRMIPVAWVREGVAFTLLGLTVMRGNLKPGTGRYRPIPVAAETFRQDPGFGEITGSAPAGTKNGASTRTPGFGASEDEW